MPDRDQWENCPPRFSGDDGEILVEHLLDFVNASIIWEFFMKIC